MQLNLGKIKLAFDEPIELPRMVPVKQRFKSESISNGAIAETIRLQFQRSDLRQKVSRGMKIAVGVGSRGIENLGAEVEAHPMMEVSGAPREWQFDRTGHLSQRGWK